MNEIRSKYKLPLITEPFVEKQNHAYILSDHEHLFNMPASLYWMDEKGFYLGANALALSLMQMTSSKEIRSKTIFDVGLFNDWPNALAEKVYQQDMEVIATGKIAYAIHDIFPRGRNAIIMKQLAVKAPIIHEGIVIGLRGVSIEMPNDLVNIDLMKLKKKLPRC